MIDLVASSWPGYELLDSGDGRRLERFGAHTVIRPDATCRWKPSHPEHSGWTHPDLSYEGKSGNGEWRGNPALLSGWTINWHAATFQVIPTPFRHLALFPEQSAHWSWIQESLKKIPGKPKVLNLFAYTGAASVVAALAGAEVCHVDASKPSIARAKHNAQLSGLPEDAIRWIIDDALKFMRREVRRGNRYDLVIMDPPVFGRGTQGEIWRLETGIAELATLASELLTEKPIGLLLNFYATNMYPDSIRRVVSDAMGQELQLGTLYLHESLSGKRLQTGYFLRS